MKLINKDELMELEKISCDILELEEFFGQDSLPEWVDPETMLGFCKYGIRNRIIYFDENFEKQKPLADHSSTVRKDVFPRLPQFVLNFAKHLGYEEGKQHNNVFPLFSQTLKNLGISK